MQCEQTADEQDEAGDRRQQQPRRVMAYTSDASMH